MVTITVSKVVLAVLGVGWAMLVLGAVLNLFERARTKTPLSNSLVIRGVAGAIISFGFVYVYITNFM